jgi:hypothetical protein
MGFGLSCPDYPSPWIASAGNCKLLAFGGHGFEMLEPTEIIEVKQGPYAGDGDKKRFEGVPPSQVKLRKPSA